MDEESAWDSTVADESPRKDQDKSQNKIEVDKTNKDEVRPCATVV